MFFALLLALIALSDAADNIRSSNGDNNRNSNSHRLLKITLDLIPFHNAQPKSVVEWYEQFASPIYCVGGEVRDLKFTCEGCNDDQKQFLAENTHDMSRLVSFPSIKVNGALQDGYKWNNKKLICTGHDTNGNSISISSPISVSYRRKPTIVNHLFKEPILDATGLNRFFMLDGTSSNNNQTMFSLVCQMDANPPAKNFTWSIDGQWSSSDRGQLYGSALRVTDRILGKPIACKASNEKDKWIESHPVYTEKAVLPQPVKRDFGSLASSSSERNRMTGPKNSVPLGFTADMHCSFIGYPKPRIHWVYANYSGGIHEADCGSKRFPDVENLQQEPIFTSRRIWNINNTCSIRFTKFDQSGTYWCRACMDLAQNQTVCDTAPTLIPAYALFLNVTGPPNNVGKPMKIESNPIKSSHVKVYVPFCANPPPDTGRSYVLVNDHAVFVTESEHGVTFKEIKRDEFNPFCFESIIEFDENDGFLDSIHDNNEIIDRRRTYQFFVSNSLGNFTLPISLSPVKDVNITDAEQTMGNNGMVDSEHNNNSNVTLTVTLTSAAFLIIGACIFIYLWINRKACFSYRKNDEKSLDCTKESRNCGSSFPEKSGAVIDANNENDKAANEAIGNFTGKTSPYYPVNRNANNGQQQQKFSNGQQPGHQQQQWSSTYSAEENENLLKNSNQSKNSGKILTDSAV